MDWVIRIVFKIEEFVLGYVSSGQLILGYFCGEVKVGLVCYGKKL
jgi:hypothetical protein